MLTFLTKLFAPKPKTDLNELIRKGAIVLDVRTKGEYQQGHLRGSINIPLKNLQDNLSKIRKDKAVITCCATGSRSGVARSILRSKGYTEVYNAGAWTKLKKYKN